MYQANLIFGPNSFSPLREESSGEKKVILSLCQCFSHGFVASTGRGDDLAQCSVNEIWKVSPRFALWAGRKMRAIILLFWWPAGKTEWSVIVFSKE